MIALLRRLALVAAMAAPFTVQAARLLIFGEQHDQPDQQRQVAEEVKSLAAAGRLAGVVLEMAETPHNTAALPRDAGEAEVRDALQWQGWPWEPYAAVVMNAVRAGVAVWGGNLPRSAMRDAMGDASLDARATAATREQLAAAVRTGHCNLLPESQEPGMVRIQLARDLSMATVIDRLAQQASAGSSVLLLTGAMHASRDRGVPLHLLSRDGWHPQDLRVVVFSDADDGLQADERRSALFTPQPDQCAALRQRLRGGAASTPAASR